MYFFVDEFRYSNGLILLLWISPIMYSLQYTVFLPEGYLPPTSVTYQYSDPLVERLSICPEEQFLFGIQLQPLHQQPIASTPDQTAAPALRTHLVLSNVPQYQTSVIRQQLNPSPISQLISCIETIANHIFVFTLVICRFLM